MKVIACLLILPIFISCATIVGKGGPETLNIRSALIKRLLLLMMKPAPKYLKAKLPLMCHWRKKKGYFSGKKYTVKISKEGYAVQTITVDTTPNGWYIGGNILLGGLIGWLIVDPATGAM